ATVREIAREAKLSLGGLYAYIGSKEDILYLFFDKITTTLRDEMRRAIEAVEDPVARVRAALHAGLKTTETYQDEILLMYQETKSLGRASRRAVLSREAEYVAFFEEILRDGYARGVFKGDPRLAADAVAYVCSIIALRRWSLNSRFAPEQVREGLISFILRGLGVPVEDADETLRRHAAGAVLAWRMRTRRAGRVVRSQMTRWSRRDTSLARSEVADDVPHPAS
ncbi:MAG: TetR family transcriptional regulator, partial [Actinobacteria bacterium]|nr:TetR family transcriptional regulator [Actinomycetota bacterium]